MTVDTHASTLDLLLRFNQAQTVRVQQLARLQTAQSHAAVVAGYERVCSDATPMLAEASNTIRAVAAMLATRPSPDVELAESIRQLQSMEKERFETMAQMHSYGLQTLAGTRDFTDAEQQCKERYG
ncbi:hypothetical protein SYNPS1DRAFT_21039 [Syncephalis pseudoplumigaleata]|uniref:Uncharacterized protein n=1 Tax=Syncephalis pseudoplumigaleata TaxID=1712513 RepID=A0A4P9Z4C9_9FUNG|nr:hypothetical protein SYNPS1DRAFT_21039 [Syncephalis pseudoplumigaleata]|eukprot:RKP27424.1 hypothetical protein SYNPS1DRAFT_21039 [Syncephalis pseudoplumigaleata]